MKRLTLALLTAVAFLLALGGTSAFPDSSSVQPRRGIIEEAEANPLFHYGDGFQIKPRGGVYEGETYGGRKISFVVHSGGAGGICDDPVTDFRLSGDVYIVPPPTFVCRKHAYVKGIKLPFAETYFSACDPNLYREARCIVGRWAANDVVFGTMPVASTTNHAGYTAQWVRPVG